MGMYKFQIPNSLAFPDWLQVYFDLYLEKYAKILKLIQFVPHTKNYWIDRMEKDEI